MQFRVHIKTHKTSEGTRLQLDPFQSGDQGRQRADRLIVSTVEEGWMLVNSGTLRDHGVKSVSSGIVFNAQKWRAHAFTPGSLLPAARTQHS